MSFVTSTRRVEEITRPSFRRARASTVRCPLRVPSVFHLTTQRRDAQTSVRVRSIKISTRRTLSPFARPTISTVPVACVGAVTLTDTPDCCENESGGLRSDPIRDAEISQWRLHKAVSSRAEAHVPAHEQPFLR
jgi:hypothetical protein